MKTKLSGLLGVFLLAGAMVANATPVDFHFSSTVGGDGSTIPGTSLGQSFLIDILADNGSSSLLSQTWNLSDFLSASVDIGNGAYTYSATGVPQSFTAATDATGADTNMLLSFHGTGLYGSTWLIVNGFRNIMFDGSYLADATDRTTPNNFSVASSTSVPEPSSLGLICAGLLGVFAVSRRRKAPNA